MDKQPPQIITAGYYIIPLGCYPLKNPSIGTACLTYSKAQITILACISVSRQTMTSMMVFAGKHFSTALAKGEVLYEMSTSV